MNRVLNSYKLPFLASILCVIGMLVGMRLQESLYHDGYLEKKISSPETAIFEASEHIRSKYYGERSVNSYTDAVIGEMMDQLDPYSHYFQEEKSMRYDQYVNGLFRGLGLEFVEYRDSIFIANVVRSSPAAQAGLQVGDILAVYDSIEVKNPLVNLDSIKRLSEQPLGAEVTLGLFKQMRQNQDAITYVDLEISDIDLPLMEDFILMSEDFLDGKMIDSIGYFKINRFYKGVYRDFMESMESHKRNYGLEKAIIIDLRGNPGGIVDETMKILNQLFREKDQLLLSTISKIDIGKEYVSSGRSFLNTERVMVLCDRNSASASEILAGVLQDYDKAVLLGEQTFGKGLIQQNYDLSNNGSINLSVGEYILPTGRRINPTSHIDSTYTSLANKRSLYSERGITPDVEYLPCQNSADNKYLFHLMAQFDLWTLKDYAQMNVELLDKQLLNWGFDQKCLEDFHSFAKWALAKESKEFGEFINVENADPTIAKAFELILSEQYDELLNN